MMHWEIQQGTEVTGPFSEDEILMMVEAGRIHGETMVRPEGKQAWKPATRHGRFAAALRAVAGEAAGGALTGGAAGGAATGGDGAAGPDTARSRRAPIDGIPFKDPARWDQQTQLGMPVATLLPGGVPAILAEARTGASNGASAPHRAASADGASAAATASGVATGGPPPFPGGGQSASAPPHASAVGGVVPASASAPQTGTPLAAAMSQARVMTPAQLAPRRPEGGLLSGLFDLGFTQLVTARVTRILYALYVIAVLVALAVGTAVGVGAVQTALRLGSDTMLLAGVAQLVATPLVCLCALVVGRVVAESVVVFFRMADHLGEIERRTRG